MMELCEMRVLVLTDQLWAKVSEQNKPLYILEWLRYLEKSLASISKADVKANQRQLIEQLLQTIQNGSLGPPARVLIAQCMTSLFVIGDTVMLFDTVNSLNDVLKLKDDAPSSMAIKLAALSCLGEMYEKLGRMMGRSYEETIQILSKSFRNMESQARVETMIIFQKICIGMDNAASSAHKDLYKIAKVCLTDRVLIVRKSAAQTIEEMLRSATFLYLTELENLTSLCFRALDGADFDTRMAISNLLGYLISLTQQPINPKTSNQTNSSKPIKTSLEDAFNILMTGFLRGATSFLKGEIIKGGSGVNREVRIGVTHAYITFIEKMGPIWLEKHLEVFTNHILELVSNPKASTSHVDAVYSRKCVNFIFRRTFGRLLGEKAMFTALKILSAIVVKQMNCLDFNPENAKESNKETIFNQHLLVCSLQEMSALFLCLGTSIQDIVTDSSLGMLNGIFSVLIHPCHSTRLAAAWALRSLCVALPSQTYKCIERCLQGFEKLKSSPEALSGYSSALAAIIGGVRYMPLGIPHPTGKILFNIAEDLLRSAHQNSRLSLSRSAAGWLLIGSIMTLGNSVVKSLLPRMLLLWRNSFPKSVKELESEKSRGDAFTWNVTLEGRAGALSSIHSFLLHCSSLITDEIITRLLVPIESCLAMMTNLNSTLKMYGQQLKASAAILRFRLYETLALIKPMAFERSYTHILRFVVWELTLNDNPANTTTSLFNRICQSNSIFNSLVSDHISIEDQLQPTGAAGSGSLEHDPCTLYRSLPEGTILPIPLPLGVAIIDLSIELFGILYPHISVKHRNQLNEHFAECLKVNKYTRKEAALINIFCAFLCAMKSIRKLSSLSSISSTNCSAAESLKSKKETTICCEDFCKNFVLGALSHSSNIIRCAAAEVLGRVAQTIADSKFTGEMAQYCVDKLKISRDVANRTGHSLALGCLHKYLGGMDGSRHQHGSVSILLNLAQDISSPDIQMWALHSLALVADTGGPLFRSYVEPSLFLVMKLILTVPFTSVDLRQVAGKMISALITGVGPELESLQLNLKVLFEIGPSILSNTEEHPLVQEAALNCFQKLHLFGQKINFEIVIPVLYRSINSTNLALRRSAIDCFRQLCQRDALVVCQKVALICQNEEGSQNADFGLIGALFRMLDLESDEIIRKGIKDTLISALSTVVLDESYLTSIISLCKTILTSDVSVTNGSPDELGEFDDDVEDFKIGSDEQNINSITYNSRWSSRVFAAECVRKVVINSPFIMNQTGANLLIHLSDLIRMSFMGATSNSDPLRLEGLLNLETIIDKFSHLKDPDFPSISILEQFQAQVSSALRPAFSIETDPKVKATACRVCASWICGNSKNGEDLRRVNILMVSALENIRTKPTLPEYNESANTLEKLSILKAWAVVFNKAVENGLESGESLENIFKDGLLNKNDLLELIKPHLSILSPLWISLLRDRALIELPPAYTAQLPREGGSFFSNETREVVQPYYKDSWPQILLASSVCVSLFPHLANHTTTTAAGEDNENKESRTEIFYLIFGLSMEALCKPTFSEPLDLAKMYLKSLWILFNSRWPKELITKERVLAIELCSVLHKQLVTRCDIQIQFLVINILKLIIQAMQIQVDSSSSSSNNIKSEEKEKEKELAEKDKNIVQNGELVPGNSIVLSILEVIFCLLMQKITLLNTNVSGFHVKVTGTIDENNQLLSETVQVLSQLVSICPSDCSTIAIQPTLLYLTTCVLGELSDESSGQEVFDCFRQLATHRLNSNVKWSTYLQCTLVKLLDMVKTSGQVGPKYLVRLLISIGIFIKDAPNHLISNPHLLYPAINLYQQNFQSGDDFVRLKTIGVITEIFEKSHKSVGIPFIHALAPRVLQYLYSDEALRADTKLKLEFTLECIKSIQTLVQIVDSSEKRIQMLTLIIPVLINFLSSDGSDGSYYNLTPQRKLLHDFSLNKLMKIGPKYPNEFKLLISQSGEMRRKLESAIKNSKRPSQSELTPKNLEDSSATELAGTIKLKTDFSNFN